MVSMDSGYRATCFTSSHFVHLAIGSFDLTVPLPPPPTSQLMPSRLNWNLFLDTAGGLLGARGSSVISFLLAFMERSLALVRVDSQEERQSR